MSGLEIQPHSPRVTALAIAFLSLLAAGSFVAGLNHQLITAGGPTLFPAPPPGRTVAPAPIPEATPAPDMQLAEARPAHRTAKPQAVADDPAQQAAAPPAAEAAPAVDAAAIAPEAAPAPAAPPTTPDNPPPTGA